MSTIEAWHRRHAIQIAAQLPEKTEDALAVLEAATQLVRGFLSEPDPERKPAPIVTLIGGKPAKIGGE